MKDLMHHIFKKITANLTILSIFTGDMAFSMREEAPSDETVRGPVRLVPTAVVSSVELPRVPPSTVLSVGPSVGFPPENSLSTIHTVDPIAISLPSVSPSLNEDRAIQLSSPTGASIVSEAVVSVEGPNSRLMPNSARSDSYGLNEMLAVMRNEQPFSLSLMDHPLLIHQQPQVLSKFLENMGWEKEDLRDCPIPLTLENLQRILTVEFSFFPPRWVNIDHFFEKLFYVSLLDREGVCHEDHNMVNLNTPCCSRFWIRGRAIPFKSKTTLRKAIAVNELRQGIEDGVLNGLHLTLLGLLGYQLTHTTKVNLVDTFNQADHTSILGIANLMHRQPEWWCVLIVPIVLGLGKALWNMCQIDDNPRSGMGRGNERDDFPKGMVGDYARVLVPFYWKQLNHPVDSYLTKRQKMLLWDGRATHSQREATFEEINYLAKEGIKIGPKDTDRYRGGYTQLTAMHSLARILHGHHLKDYEKLSQAYDKRDLLQLLSMKTRSLETLERLSNQRSTICERVNARYADYLLWTLGYSPSRRNSTVMSTIKLGKTAFQFLFLKMLIETINEYINCPDKPGFTWTGYEPWASDYSVACFDELVREFNTIPGQPISTLTDNIGQYYFPSGTYVLDLSHKGLSGDAVLEIIQGFANNRITLTSLNLAGNNVNKARFFNSIVPLIPSVEWLNLSENSIEDPKVGSSMNDTIALAQNFANLPSLTFLDLSRNGIGITGSQGTVSLGNGLQYLRFLKTFNLSNNWLEYTGSIGTIALGNGLRYVTSLTSLDLSANYYIGFKDSEGTIALGNGLKNLPSLTSLNLSTNYIGYRNSNGTIAIGNGLQFTPSLISFDLSNNWVGYIDSQGTVAIGNGLQNLTSLTSLDVSLNNIGSKDPNGIISLAQGITFLKHLQSFNINQQLPPLNSTSVSLLNEGLTPTAVRSKIQSPLSTLEDVEVFFSTVPSTVTSLNFSTLIGDPQIIGSLMRRLANYTSLTSLDLSHNFIEYTDFQGIVAIGNGLRYTPNLSSLYLSYNSIGFTSSEGEVAIGNGLRYLPFLTSLDLYNNWIGYRDSNGTIAIGKGLHYLSSLTSLDLSRNLIDYTDCKGTVAIGNAFQSLTSLTFLDLSSNYYIGYTGSEGEVTLGNGLPYLRSLTSLDFSTNRLGYTSSQGIIAIGNGLRPLSSLTFLDFSTNFIGNKDSQGTIALANAFNSLKSLQVLNLSWNPIGSTNAEGPKAILEALPKLSELQVIGLVGAQNISWTEGAQALATLKGGVLRDACEAEICFSTPIHPSLNLGHDQQKQALPSAPTSGQETSRSSRTVAKKAPLAHYKKGSRSQHKFKPRNLTKPNLPTITEETDSSVTLIVGSSLPKQPTTSAKTKITHASEVKATIFQTKKMSDALPTSKPQDLLLGSVAQTPLLEEFPQLLPARAPAHSTSAPIDRLREIPTQTSSATRRAQPIGAGVWEALSSAVEYTKSCFSFDAWVDYATKAAFNLAVERDGNGCLVNSMPATFPNLFKSGHYDWAVSTGEMDLPGEQAQSAERNQLLLNVAAQGALSSLVPGHQPLAITAP